jgi:phage shock protein PspC (stress-responsive transcriptional regulator)
METIKNINYQGRIIAIEESASVALQAYENELKNYFLAQEEGEEIFTDLQTRIGEILDSKLKKGANAITMNDINELKSTIGNPSDFEDSNTTANNNTNTQNTTFTKEEKKLYRSINDKIIGGVAGGLANYMDIDATVIRLLFVLVTAMSGGFGLIVYGLLYFILTPKVTQTNMNRKLFRNKKDKVIGGVCSGLAEFFSIEIWIVRLLFAAPLLLNIFNSNYHFGFVKVHVFNNSLSSIALTTYIILWIVTKYAESSTDYMLMKGKPINLTTMNQTTINSIKETSSSAIRTILKVLAYIVVFLLVITFIPSMIGITGASIFSYNFIESILSTPALKLLAVLSFMGLIILPSIALIIWVIRKIGNYKSPNNPLRKVFGILGLIGFVSAIFLSISLIREMNTYTLTKQTLKSQFAGNTLYIKPTDSITLVDEHLFSLNNMSGVFNIKNGVKEVKAVDINYEETNDSNFYIEIKRGSLGSDYNVAKQYCSKIMYEPTFENNTLYLPSVIQVAKNDAYRGQHVKVTCYIPKGKTVVVDKELKKQLSHHFNFSKHGINVDYNDYSSDEEDEKMTNTEEDEEWVIKVDDNNDETLTKEEKKKLQKEAKEEIKNAIQDASDQLEVKKKEMADILNDKDNRLKEATEKIKKAIDTATIQIK